MNVPTTDLSAPCVCMINTSILEIQLRSIVGSLISEEQGPGRLTQDLLYSKYPRKELGPEP